MIRVKIDKLTIDKLTIDELTVFEKSRFARPIIESSFGQTGNVNGGVNRKRMV